MEPFDTDTLGEELKLEPSATNATNSRRRTVARATALCLILLAAAFAVSSPLRAVAAPVLALLGTVITAASQAEGMGASLKRVLMWTGLTLSAIFGTWTIVESTRGSNLMLSNVRAIVDGLQRASANQRSNMEKTEVAMMEARRSAATSEANLAETQRLLEISRRTLADVKEASELASGGDAFPLASVSWITDANVYVEALFQIQAWRTSRVTAPTARRTDEVDGDGTYGDRVYPYTLPRPLYRLATSLYLPEEQAGTWRGNLLKFDEMGGHGSAALIGKINLRGKDRVVCKVESSARNGSWEQVFVLRRVSDGKWAWRTVVGGRFATTKRPGVLADRASIDFPRDERHRALYPPFLNEKEFLTYRAPVR